MISIPMPLSDEDVTLRLQEFEVKHDLLRHTVDGWSAWPMLRLSVARAMQATPIDQGGIGLSKKELLPIALNDLLRVLSARRARYMVKTLSSYHSELEGEQKKDIFFDDLLKKTGNFYKIEAINGRNFHLNVHQNLIPRDLSTAAFGIIAGKLARRRPVKGLESISSEISRCVSMDLELAITPQSITEILAAFYWGKFLYRALLKRVQPQHLLLADVGDFPVTAAARELGINVVEFQHGMIHKHYPAISWGQYALAYKARMAIPDRVFLFGSYWQREMEADGFWGDELCAVGSLRVDHYRNQPSARNDDVCTMVVTTQGIDTNRMIAFFEEFTRMAKGRLPYRLIFKMHPVYQTTDRLFATAFGTNGNVRLVSAAEQPSTFELMKMSNLHVSIYSTCHYEALALGVPTVILPLAGAERVLHLREAGGAYFPGSPQELFELAQRWRDLHVPREVGDRYFSPGALERIEYELAS